ncbi:Solute carrier family 43 member 3, partial [Larimichthys crocea]
LETCSAHVAPTIITLYNGAFDSSSALFLVIKLLHETGISLRASFLFLSACSAIHLFRTFFLLPRKFIPHPLPDGYTYGITCGKSKNLGSEETTANGETPRKYDNVSDVPVKQEKTFRECFLSRFFLWHLLWLSVMQLRHYLFIGTLNPMLQRLTAGEPSLVSQYINAFAITQLCGVLCAPWNGLIMDRHKGKPRAAGESEQDADLRSSVLSLSLTALQCVLFSVCASTPYLPLQYLTFILQYPCFALVKGALDGDPLYVNIALTLLSMVAFIHPLSVYLHCRSAQRAKNSQSNRATTRT